MRTGSKTSMVVGTGMRGALNRDMATTGVYDALNHRKAETCSFTGSFGCEVGLENTVLHFRGYAVAGIPHKEPQIRPGCIS